jgi:hypothetical protein
MYQDSSVHPTSRQNLHWVHWAKLRRIASPSVVHDAVWRLARTPGVRESMSASLNGSFVPSAKSPPPHFINMTDSRAHRHSDTRRLNFYQICFRQSKYSTDGLQASTTSIFRSPRKGAYLALFRWMDTDLAVEVHRVRLCQTGKTEMLRLALIH